VRRICSCMTASYPRSLSFISLSPSSLLISYFFFFNDPATTEIYTLSLHDALPIYFIEAVGMTHHLGRCGDSGFCSAGCFDCHSRSEEHTSELQLRSDLVCRLLLEKKKKKNYRYVT